MATLIWASNFSLQPTGYARIAREILPRLQEDSDHDVMQFAVSGLNNVMPFTLNGIDTIGPSSAGGNLGVADYPVVDQMQGADFWLLNFDTWAVGEYLDQMDLRYVLYPPVDHDPIAANWVNPIENAYEIVPYCQFGKRVMEEAMETTEFDMDKIREPIYHGVDTDVYQPQDDVTKQQVFGVSEDTFTIGIFKNNQGTRWAPVRQLRAIKLFIDKHDLWDDVLIYLHSSIQGEGAFDLSVIVNRLELNNVVHFVNQGEYRWGVDDNTLISAYNACDVVMNVTKGEGFGLPILEALACETPVIAGAYSSMPELLGKEEGEIKWEAMDPNLDVEAADEADHEGSIDPEAVDVVDAPHGWLVPVWDVEATLGKHSWRRTYRAEHITAALTQAYNHPDEREERAATGHEWVQQYDWDLVAEQWIDYFDALEERTFETDEDMGIEWAQVDQEKGGVGGFQ